MFGPHVENLASTDELYDGSGGSIEATAWVAANRKKSKAVNKILFIFSPFKLDKTGENFMVLDW